MPTSSEHQKAKVANVWGRYVTNDALLDFLAHLPDSVQTDHLGNSVLGEPVKGVLMGSGSKRILMWSQMHGNEATTTKAVLDLINYLLGSPQILETCTLRIIPILNPDGARAYTRANADGVDLNRDAQELSQPESRVLRDIFDSFRPDFCFNLHDQRTIYNVGRTDRPATVSFLSPSVDEARSSTPAREQAMRLVVAMNGMLQEVIPGQVGRYDDAFNPNCVGDTFQGLGCTTVLFEAGHYQKDYNREKTRELIFQSLVKALHVIGEGTLPHFAVKEYLEIPENGKLFFDILIKNIDRYDPRHQKGSALGILYDEVLDGRSLRFVPKVEKIGRLDSFFGHSVYDCRRERDLSHLQNDKKIGSLIDRI